MFKYKDLSFPEFVEVKPSFMRDNRFYQANLFYPANTDITDTYTYAFTNANCDIEDVGLEKAYRLYCEEALWLAYNPWPGEGEIIGFWLCVNASARPRVGHSPCLSDDYKDYINYQSLYFDKEWEIVIGSIVPRYVVGCKKRGVTARYTPHLNKERLC